MSLILDALRKMEQDRKGKSGPAAVLRPDVLRYRARTAKRRRTTRYPLFFAGVVVLAAGIAAGMFALGRHNRVPVTVGPSAVTTSVADSTPVLVPAPATLPPAATATATAPPAPAPPQAKPVTESANTVVAAPSPAATEVLQVDAETAKEPKPAKAKRPRLPQTKPEHRDATESVQPPPQDIVISGIAWQEERNLRRAVLNGTLVAEGASVAGARVVEIKEDRVRLSRAGQSFEIPFSSALSSR
jgi:general secretion pathway protein B